MSRPTQRLALALVLGGLILPLDVRAQIASPFSAGANSGAGGLGSSSSSIGSANFTSTPESQSPDVTRQTDGSLTTSAEKLEKVRDAILKIMTQPEVQILAPVVEFTRPAPAVEIAGVTLAQGLLPASDDQQILALKTSLSNQLVASGLEPPKANQLVSLLVSLSQQSNLNQLSDAINLFNQVIRESSPEVLNSLRQNPAFIAISSTLRSARKTLGS